MKSLILLIIIIPLVEIFIMIKVGHVVGAFNTILLIAFTAFAGIYYAKLEGLSTLKAGLNQLVKNEIPAYELMSGATIAIGALLLIFPGFLTDLIGLILIVPYTRKLLFRSTISKFKKENFTSNYIEGESSDIDEDKK
jgi:UPF0716 protein FxsA